MSLLIRDSICNSGSCITIVRDSPSRLELKCGWTTTSFDARTRRVMRGKRVLCGFSAVRQVRLMQCRGDEDNPTVWSVSLDTGGWSALRIGRDADSMQASVVAARIATITGCKVVA